MDSATRLPSRRSRINLGPALAIASSLLLIALSLGSPVVAAEPVFEPTTAGTELMRLLNGERTANGLPELAIDPFLASKAATGAVACPNGAGTMEGRAKDMATSGYFSHALRLCPSYDINDALDAWGYDSWTGEILAWNGGYGFSPFTYEFGCDVQQTNCSTTTTKAPVTVAIASYGYMTSSGHRAIVLSSNYDRFGCGAWRNAGGEAYYACLFSFGPGTQSLPAPTPAPTPTGTPAPSATPAPTPTATPVINKAPTVARKPDYRYSGRIRFKATFADANGVRAVRFYVDGKLRWSGDCYGAKSCTKSVSIRLTSVSRGWHTQTWRAADTSGKWSTVSAGSHRFKRY